ncbi:sulfotransferase [Escherichia coli]|nr:sulfotransferase [Escherichia coli]
MKIFIVGSARTGTSSLFFALKTAFDIPGFGESHVMPLFQRAIYYPKLYYREIIKSNEDIMIRSFNFPNYEQMVFEHIRNFYAATYGGDSWIDKTPTSEAIHGIGFLSQVFPDARIICTKRNGLEVIRSQAIKFGAPFHELCEDWVAAMEGIQNAANSPNLRVIDQADMAARPGEVGNSLCDWLGVPNKGEGVGAYLAANRIEATLGLEDAPASLLDVKWSDQQKRQFDEICGPMMRRFGYGY